MKNLWWWLGGLMLAQKIWKYWLVRRFFKRPVPAMTREPQCVTILQPILSGDPTLRDCLAANLAVEAHYPLEFVWLVDDDDPAGLALCHELAASSQKHTVRIVTLPPPQHRDNPKMVKLRAGLTQARGDVICVLDDDTCLPDYGLERCLPFLDQPGVGLAFGLPYYRCFGNFWSSLVSLFVNDHSLLTYIPYTTLTEPFTINGMFYAVRREVLEQVGGFNGLESVLADDFAVAQRFRSRGYRLAQTPLCHPISTFVNGPRHYLNLLQRWFIFPRESLLRHLNRYDRSVLYSLALLPALFPLVLIITFIARPSWAKLSYVLIYFGHSLLTYRRFNQFYLQRVTPPRWVWLTPFIEILVPVQLLAALVSPLRVVWRGHLMQVEQGGQFHFVRRRTPTK